MDFCSHEVRSGSIWYPKDAHKKYANTLLDFSIHLSSRSAAEMQQKLLPGEEHLFKPLFHSPWKTANELLPVRQVSFAKAASAQIVGRRTYPRPKTWPPCRTVGTSSDLVGDLRIILRDMILKYPSWERDFFIHEPEGLAHCIPITIRSHGNTKALKPKGQIVRCLLPSWRVIITTCDLKRQAPLGPSLQIQGRSPILEPLDTHVSSLPHTSDE